MSTMWLQCTEIMLPVWDSSQSNNYFKHTEITCVFIVSCADRNVCQRSWRRPRRFGWETVRFDWQKTGYVPYLTMQRYMSAPFRLIPQFKSQKGFQIQLLHRLLVNELQLFFSGLCCQVCPASSLLPPTGEDLQFIVKRKIRLSEHCCCHVQTKSKLSHIHRM